MEVTYILGNGFDMQMGLDTSFKSFLRKYTVVNEKDSENIKLFKQEIQSDIDSWAYAEEQIGLHLGGFSDENLDLFYERKNDFEESMRMYLLDQKNRWNYSNANEIFTRFSDFLFASYLDVMNRRSDEIKPINEGINYNFITFNYTGIINEILNCFPKGKPIRSRNSINDYIGIVVPVHRTLETAPFFGVNDDSQIDCEGGVTVSQELKWNLIKPVLNNESGYHWDIKAHNVILNSNHLYIYGISFGKTDNVWWNLIREWLNSSKSHKIIWFIKDDNIINEHIAQVQLSEEKKYRIKLLGNLGFDIHNPNVEQFNNQIFIIHNTKRLEFTDLLMDK